MKFLASVETVGLLGNWTSVALRIVFSSRMVACSQIYIIFLRRRSHVVIQRL